MSNEQASEYYNYLLKQIERVDSTLNKLESAGEEGTEQEVKSLRRLKEIHNEKLRNILSSHPELGE
ncbi:hypothetical protein [Aurantivibrio plasticivorans]